MELKLVKLIITWQPHFREVNFAVFIKKQNENKITSFTFPESITNTTSFMVTLVSAMFVDNICKENNKYPNYYNIHC